MGKQMQRVSGGNQEKLEAPSAFAYMRWDGTDAFSHRARVRPRIKTVMSYRASGGGGGGFAPVGSGGRFDCPGSLFPTENLHDDIVGPDIALATLLSTH